MTKRIEFHGIRVNEWTPAKECELAPRQLREAVTKFNDRFGMDNNHRYYIISSVSGYKLTRDLKEIRSAIEHDERIARRQINRIRKRKSNLENYEYKVKHGGELV